MHGLLASPPKPSCHRVVDTGYHGAATPAAAAKATNSHLSSQSSVRSPLLVRRIASSQTTTREYMRGLGRGLPSASAPPRPENCTRQISSKHWSSSAPGGSGQLAEGQDVGHSLKVSMPCGWGRSCQIALISLGMSLCCHATIVELLHAICTTAARACGGKQWSALASQVTQELSRERSSGGGGKTGGRCLTVPAR